MKKIFLPIIVTLSCNISLAQNCPTPPEFNSTFEYENNVLSVNIERKDKQPFKYKDIENKFGLINVGFRFSDNRDFILNTRESNIVYGGPSYNTDNTEIKYIQGFGDLFEKQGLISRFLLLAYHSERYKIILTKEIESTKYSTKLNIPVFMQDFQTIFKRNKMEGPTKIKFYTILIHSQIPAMSCSYFESKDFVYNIDPNAFDANAPYIPQAKDLIPTKKPSFFKRMFEKIETKFYSLFL